MSDTEIIDQILNDLYTSKLTRDDIAEKYHISDIYAGIILKNISQSPEILREHHVLMVEKVENNGKRGRANTYFLTPIPIEIQIYDLTLGISLLNFKEYYQKYYSYLNFSSDDSQINIALENCSAYLGYNQIDIQNQLLKNTKLISSNITPFLFLDDFEVIDKVAYKIQEADGFLARYFIRQENSIIEIFNEFYKTVEYYLQTISDKKEFPIFELQTGIKYLSWAIRFYGNNEKYWDIHSKLLQISEQLFILLFIPPEVRDSLSIEQVSKQKNLSRDLIKNLKVLGIEANDAFVLDLLLHNKEAPISKFYSSSPKKIKHIKNSLKELVKKGVVVSFNKNAENNRIINYYSLNKSPEQIYCYLESKNKKKFENLYQIFNSTNWNNFGTKNADEIVKQMIKIGISPNASRIMVYLHLNPKKPSRMIQSSDFINGIVITELLRNLYEANWIIAEEIGHTSGHSDTRYSLSEPLYDIILKYLINYFEQVEHSLKEVEAEFSKLEEDYEPINEDEFINAPKIVQEKGYKLIIESLEPILLSHSNKQDQSFVLELKPPLPNLIRIYLTDMRISLSKDAYVARLIFGNKRGEVWNFDNTDVSYTVLCGYIDELNMFILFDTSFHTNISYHKKISVPIEMVYKAISYEQIFKRITNNKEIVIIVPPNKFIQGLEQRYELHLQNLISGNFKRISINPSKPKVLYFHKLINNQ